MTSDITTIIIVFSAFTAILAVSAISLFIYSNVKRTKQQKQIEEKEIAPGITQSMLDEALKYCNECASKFEALSKEIIKPSIKIIIADLGFIIRNLAKDFQQDPVDITFSKTFLTRRLEQALELTETYVRLAKQKLDLEGKKQLEEAEKTLALYQKGFLEHLQKCNNNDLAKLKLDNKMSEYFFKESNI